MTAEGQLLTIGQLAELTGVATSALRYWERVGLVRPSARVSGQRRYEPAAVGLVGVVLFLRDVGFSLDEIHELFRAWERDPTAWRELTRRKLADLDAQLGRLQEARLALAHSLECEHDDITQCPNFRAVIAARLTGKSLEEAHRAEQAVGT